jgi:ferredoxin-type protein NapG
LKALFGSAFLGPGVWGLLTPEKAHAGVLGSPVTINRLRPPGAVDEDDFAGRCIRCGRCVEVCPYRCVLPLDIRSGVHAGTPLIAVQDSPCFLCMKCVEVCPTGALQDISYEETRMGLAVVDHHTCVAWTGETLCRTCYSVCPLRDQAIELVEFRPVVNSEVCVGCGICVNACPVTLSNGFKPVTISPHARAQVGLSPDGLR